MLIQFILWVRMHFFAPPSHLFELCMGDNQRHDVGLAHNGIT